MDLIIVGQGLAGSALAMRAIARNYKILVLDQPSQNRSSLVAAGLFNPFTGRKMAKTWMADALFPALSAYYRAAERLTATTFFHEMPLHRPFVSLEEQNEWTGLTADPAYAPYIERVSPKGLDDGFVREPFGGVTLRQAGYLDTAAYLDAVRSFLLQRDAFRYEAFDPQDLRVDNDSVTLTGIRAKKIVFCQGVQNASNPWFRHLPINSLKGEFLFMQCRWEKNVILNRGVYMVPGSNAAEWRVGATYNRDDQSEKVTARAHDEIVRKLQAFFAMPFVVTGQNWGLRPTTPDRRPIVGAHPAYKSLLIFNGLGTKGVSLAPYFSEVLIRWIENEGMIHEEADVSRFY